MFWQKYRHIIISFGVATVVSLGLVYLASTNFFSTLIVAPATGSNSVNVVGDNTTVLVQEKYNLCGHLQEANFASALNLKGMDDLSLRAGFNEEAGWKLDWPKPDLLVITREIEGYCPEDASRRHLAALNGYVAIYRGPSNNVSLIERITEIKVDSLPEEWQAKLENNELEYASEKEMLETLDSLDEFSA